MLKNNRTLLGRQLQGRKTRAAGGRRQTLEQLEGRVLMAAHIVGDPTVYASIQAAVNAAKPNAVINVDPGSYAEEVTIGKTLTLHGAQAGVDGRSNLRGTNESILTGVVDSASGQTISGFDISASGVTIDGFVVQGNTSTGPLGAGIVIEPNKSGTTVVNNILQNNVAGMFLANNSSTSAALIQHNLFQNNNQLGQYSGRGIYSDGSFSGGTLTNVTIDANAFINNYGAASTTTGLEAAIALQALTANSQSNIRVTNNMFDENGKALLAFNTSNLLIQGNIITYSKDSTSAAIRFEGGDGNVTITGNTLYANPGNVVRIDTKGVAIANTSFSITGNNIYNNAVSSSSKTAVVVDAGQPTVTVNAANNWWGNTTGPGTMVQANGNNVTTSPFATTPFTLLADQSYLMLPWSTDGIIEAENFDQGGEGIAYHDVDSANLGLAKVRQPWGVDVQTTTDVGGGYNVGYMKAGEWLNYTINVATAGTYNLDVRVAATLKGGSFHFELDGANVTGAIAMPNTGGNQNWVTITTPGVMLPAGTHVLRLVVDTNNAGGSLGNINWFALRNANPNPPPAAPTNFAAALTGPTSVNLSWSDNSDNETGFVIERKDSSGVWQTLTTVPANVAGYVDTTIAPSMAYTYRVSAINGTGTSPVSNEAAIATPSEQQPVYLSDLPWTSATNGYGPVEKDMNVGQEDFGDGTTITLNGVTYAKGLGTNSTSDITYNLGKTYNYFQADIGIDDHQTTNGSAVFQVFADGVKIYDSGTMGALSATQSVSLNVMGVKTLVLHVGDAGDGNAYDWADWANARVLKTATITSTAPTGLNATAASPTEIDLAWNDLAGETGYSIERSTDGVHFAAIGAVGANVVTYADTTALAATTYSYRVIATNATSVSPASNVAQATTPAAPTAPVAASGLTATLNGSAEIDLSWIDNSGNETGFIIERSIDGVNFSPLASVGANVTNYSDTASLASNTTYSYRVRATNGVGDAPNSNVAAATTPLPPAPAAANNLFAATISSTQINLVWQDNATNETGYKIERSTDGVNFTQIALIAANSTNYSDMALSASTMYFYRIRATNAGGDSDYSAISNATTSAPTGLPTGWISADVGPVGLAGSATYSNGVYTVQGAGADIYNTSDGFQFVYQQLTGDGTIIAHVTSLTNVDANDKAGLMIRDSLAANAKEASVVVTPSNGLKFLRRGSTGGSTSSTTVNSLKAPYWLKLTRVGSTITSYYSADGLTWTMAGSQSISMGATVYIGLVVTAHKTTALATATFDNVSM